MMAHTVFVLGALLHVTVADRTYSIISVVDQKPWSAVYLAKSSSEGETVVVKCTTPVHERSLRREFESMGKLRNERWSLRPIEMFEMNEKLCVSMAREGDDLRIRSRSYSSQSFPLVTVTSIGIALLDFLKELHFKHKLIHGDIHAANLATRIDDDEQLVVLDYGRALCSVIIFWRINDLQQAMRT